MRLISFIIISSFFFISLVSESYAGSSKWGEPAIESHFLKGARFLSITTGISYDDRYGNISLIQLNVNDYIFDNLALHYGASFGYADAKLTQNGYLGGPEVGVRWHFINIKSFSIYAEGSIAAAFQQYPLKESRPKFNFDLQPGLGVTYRFSENIMLRSGLRWHHLSNARIQGRGRNWGYDGIMCYAGLMKPF